MQTERLILLRAIRHGDSNLIVHALNASGAKIGLFAKAALKSKKRFGGGVLEPFNFIEATFQSPKDDEGLAKLQEAQLIYGFEKLRASYDKLELGYYFLNCIERSSVAGSQENQGLFDLLGNSLKALEVSEKLNFLRLLFQVKFLGYQGVLPPVAHLENVAQFALRDHELLPISIDQYKMLHENIDRKVEQFLSS